MTDTHSSTQPGALRNEVRLTLQTAYAQRLIHGRPGRKGVSGIVGALDFGRRMTLIWRAAAEDDPFADWWLLRIEQELKSAQQSLRNYIQRIETLLSSLDGFRISTAQSSEPVTVTLNFATPYGYLAAYLVSDYDRLVCVLFTARHLGLIDRGRADEILTAAGRSLRRAFQLSARWRYTGVTRADFQPVNAKARAAIERMGAPPDAVLEGNERGDIAPTQPRHISRSDRTPASSSMQHALAC